jgi:hypothetical protein
MDIVIPDDPFLQGNSDHALEAAIIL